MDYTPFKYLILTRLNIITIKRITSLNKRLFPDEMLWREHVYHQIHPRHTDEVVSTFGWRWYSLLFSPRRLKHVYVVRPLDEKIETLTLRPFYQMLALPDNHISILEENGSVVDYRYLETLERYEQHNPLFVGITRITKSAQPSSTRTIVYTEHGVATFFLGSNQFKEERIIQLHGLKEGAVALTDHGGMYIVHKKDIAKIDISVPIIKFVVIGPRKIMALGNNGTAWPIDEFDNEWLVNSYFGSDDAFNIVDIVGETGIDHNGGVLMFYRNGKIFGSGDTNNVTLGLISNAIYSLPTELTWLRGHGSQQAAIGVNYSVVFNSEEVVIFSKKLRDRNIWNEKEERIITPPTVIHGAAILGDVVFLLGE